MYIFAFALVLNLTERKTAKKFRAELRNFFNQSFVIGLGYVSQFFCLESGALFQKIDLKRREDIHALTETLKLGCCCFP